MEWLVLPRKEKLRKRRKIMTTAKPRTEDRRAENWMNTKWRPLMAIQYMITCLTDFVIFPVLWSLLQSYESTALTQWQPITLQAGGFYHMSMGAIIGIAAWGRTKEKTSSTPIIKAE